MPPLVVHGLWSPRRGILLWGEHGDRPATTSMRPSSSARPHPFAASVADLTALHPGKPASATLLLPSRRGGPVASPELGARGRPQGELSLEPWSVPALLIDPSELDDPVESVRYGASVRHLRAIARFADDLVRRGRVLPTLARTELVARARWRPVARGGDAVTLRALIAATPPVGRAEHTEPDPAALVTDALHSLVDAAVRDRLAAAGHATESDGREGPFGSWLHALKSADDRISQAPGRMGIVAEGIAAWDAVTDTDLTEGTVCIRLDEVPTLYGPVDDPDDQTGDGTKWQLRFLLRSTADSSLLIPAEDVWSGKAGARFTDPEGLFAAELGRAAGVLPLLAPAVEAGKPGVHDLTVAETVEFLDGGAERLVAAGFDVELPASWGGRRKLALKLSVRGAPVDQAAVYRLGRHQLASYRWSLAVGEDALTDEELAGLAAAKSSLVRLRGRWVSVDPELLRAGLEYLRRDPDREKPPLPSPAELLALLHGFDDTPLPVTEVTTDGWIDDFLAGRVHRVIEPVEPPPTFLATLRPYQERGVAWLSFMASIGLGACLADDMGLGKTVQLLALEAIERTRAECGPTLLVCPMSLLGTWQREAAKFAPDLRVTIHHGAARDHGARLAARVAAADLVVTTYSTAARDVDELAGARWHRLVLDEAQAVKNQNTGPAQALRRIPAEHRVALTGTPVENRLADLWSLSDLLNPGVLGGRQEFRERFEIPIERRGDLAAAGELRRLTRPFLLRRLKSDPTVLVDLPEKIEIVQEYRLTREQVTLYRATVDEMMTKITDSAGVKRRGNILAAITKLKQICNHPAHLLHDGSPLENRSGKVNRLEELLAEILDSGDRALCFTQYAEFGHLLVPHLSSRLNAKIAFLHGGLSQQRRDSIVEHFQSGTGPPILLASLKTGGAGLTLTAATHVLHLDRWWNPAVEEQATDRAFRIGQRRSVQVRKFVCPGTIEERIDAVITKKESLAGMVVTDGEDWLTGLSTDSLREVFALGREAADD
ncbi:DEAD/DEAH box helicase [Amycolatopsis regifaucium]|uniref:ATP-dependent helicase n=1 Tax=Amycolatopsis regifaucium TaxID=546365 RepID=A0A154MW78_9PSEU|nr:DEAD/DEAH box helicase [Amycolatopsis regifaucium]KZB88552.1 helicase HelZ [Amycolatopsis regifaucium]OKA07276.1 ATP-dependent helicase [Amycolatopsis regifaucium]SFI50839.1 Superfamily II DNA or RNA helicase, SNF2 family [Amycolatopsis regifaucium]